MLHRELRMINPGSTRLYIRVLYNRIELTIGSKRQYALGHSTRGFFRPLQFRQSISYAELDRADHSIRTHLITLNMIKRRKQLLFGPTLEYAACIFNATVNP